MTAEWENAALVEAVAEAIANQMADDDNSNESIARATLRARAAHVAREEAEKADDEMRRRKEEHDKRVEEARSFIKRGARMTDRKFKL